MDWKDALSSIRNSVPEAEANNETENSESKSEKVQKEPLYILTDKKGRNGKIATLIEGFTIDQNQVEEIARKLKQKLGVGGSVRMGEILIQGDHKEAVRKFLNQLNFKTVLR